MLFAAFNQDCSSFAIGSENGFAVWNTDPITLKFKRSYEGEGIGIIEMFYNSNLMAVVGGGSKPRYPPNKVVIFDDYSSKIIGDLEYSGPIRGVKLRNDSITIILDTRSFVHNFSDLKLIDKIDTFYNPAGICAVCTSPTNNTMAFIGNTAGSILIKHYSKKAYSHIIFAHDNPISQMCLTRDGLRLATTSSRGTLVRVFDTFTGERLMEFRRGTVPAAIECLSFNDSGSCLGVSSDKGTLHIFSCDVNSKETNRVSSFSWMSGVVPIFGSSWSCKSFTVSEARCIFAFSPENDPDLKKYVYVLGSSGTYYKYSLDQEECQLVKSGFFLK
uniref:Anaphase-promoting complex subunit 4 WD40 domain-containing protein n=1 Tax=Arcella intermedia TaxID=1963864 RepID=A0A6B2L9W6_9EUKA